MKFSLGNYQIDTVLFEFKDSDSVIPIEPKVFDLIVYLIQNRDRVVSRDELFDNLWQGREVSDTSLSNQIKIARKLLGDNGDKQAVIKTIRGRGYQLIAKVEVLSQDNNPRLDPNLSKVQQNATEALATQDGIIRSAKLSARAKKGRGLMQNSWKWLILIIVIIGASIIFQELIVKSDHLKSSINSSAKPYIVVMPFTLSGADQDKWQPFADQLTRELIHKLSKVTGVRVVPTASAFAFAKFKNNDSIVKQIPDVEYIVDGVVGLTADNQLKLSTELSSITENNVIWSDSYTTKVSNVNFLTIQSNVAESIANSLGVMIKNQEKQLIGEHHTKNLAAYELFVLGQQQLNRLTHESLLQSVEHFRQAILIDPNYEEALVARANAYRLIMSYYEKPNEVLPKVVDSVRQTLDVNPKSADAYSSLGLAYVFAWRWQDAWQMLSAAKQADPNNALTELGFALYYAGLGEAKKVKVSLERANQIDPLNVELADWGHWALAMVGENDAAIDWANQKLQLHPDVGIIYSGASVSASIAGNHQRAISLAQKGIELDSGGTYPLLALAQAYGHANQIEKIPKLLQVVELDSRYVCPYEKAITYLFIDEQDKAFELLNQAVLSRSNCLVFTRFDPRLVAIRDTESFVALLTRVGLDDESLSRYPR